MLALSEDGYERFICKHFDPSVDVGSRYYEEYKGYDFHYVKTNMRQVHGLNAIMIMKRLNDYEIIQPIVNSSCIGESPGKELDQCKFNGYLTYDEICNPCKVKEFKEQCDYLCQITPCCSPFGPYRIT